MISSIIVNNFEILFSNIIFKFNLLFMFITSLCLLYNIINIFTHNINYMFILITVIMICTCIILSSLAIIAQYIARINTETRNRPRYWVNGRTLKKRHIINASFFMFRKNTNGLEIINISSHYHFKINL